MRKKLKRFLVLGVLLFIVSGVIGYKYFDSIKSYMSKYSSYVSTVSVVENYKTDDDGVKKKIVTQYIVDGQAYFKISSDSYENPPVLGTLMQVKYNPDNPSEAIWDNDKLNIGIVVGIVVIALLGILSIVKFFVGSKVDDTSFEEKLEKMKERRIKEEVQNYKIVPEKEEEEEIPLFKKKKKNKLLNAASDGKLSVYTVDEKNNKMIEDTNANYSSITEENIVKENDTTSIQNEVVEEIKEEVKEEIKEVKEEETDDIIITKKTKEIPDVNAEVDLSSYAKDKDNIELNNQDYVIEDKDVVEETKDEDTTTEITPDIVNDTINNNGTNTNTFDYNNNQTISSIKLTESKDEEIKEIQNTTPEVQEVKIDISDIETKVDLDDLF